MRWLAFVFAGTGLLVAGCGDHSLTRTAAFGANGSPEAGGNALILMGVRVRTEPTVSRLFGLGSYSVRPSYKITIRQISGEGQFGSFTRHVQICETLRKVSNGLLSDCAPSQVQYKLVPVPPGRYVIDSITYTTNRKTFATTFNDPGPARVQDNFGPSKIGTAVRSLTNTFTVASNTITYVGDLTFHFDPGSPFARLAPLGRDDVAAQNALSSYPNVHGVPLFQPATGGAAEITPE